MLKRITAFLNKQAEPYALRLGEKNIALSIFDYPPPAFAKSFVEKWASNRNIENNEDILKIVKSILQYSDNSFFWKNCKEIRALDDLNDEDLLIEFRDRMRGFQDKHIEHEICNYKNKIEQNIKDLSPITEAIRTLLNNACEQKNRGKALYLNRALVDLTETINNYKQNLDEAALVIRAARKLTNETGLFKGISRITGFFQDWDIARPYLKLSTLIYLTKFQS